MQDTLTITRTANTKITENVTLPFFALKDKKYWMITGDTDNLTVRFFETMSPLMGSDEAKDLPADAERISESEFVAAYVKARAAYNKKVMLACPSINTAKTAA